MLETFAGSGAVSFEALSRGAHSLVLVDERLETARENARSLGVKDSRVTFLEIALPSPLVLPGGGASFDLAFADPPYGFEALESVLTHMVPWLEHDAELALEHRFGEATPDRATSHLGDSEAGVSSTWERTETRRYGDAGLSFYRRS